MNASFLTNFAVRKILMGKVFDTGCFIVDQLMFLICPQACNGIIFSILRFSFIGPKQILFLKNIGGFLFKRGTFNDWVFTPKRRVIITMGDFV